MSLGIRLHPAAQRELDEAARYYDTESAGLGGAFLDELEHALHRIGAFPESAPFAREPVRVSVLRGFPYSVYYFVTDDLIVVLAVAHHSRRPFYWRGRQ